MQNGDNLSVFRSAIIYYYIRELKNRCIRNYAHVRSPEIDNCKKSQLIILALADDRF